MNKFCMMTQSSHEFIMAYVDDSLYAQGEVMMYGVILTSAITGFGKVVWDTSILGNGGVLQLMASKYFTINVGGSDQYL